MTLERKYFMDFLNESSKKQESEVVEVAEEVKSEDKADWSFNPKDDGMSGSMAFYCGKQVQLEDAAVYAAGANVMAPSAEALAEVIGKDSETGFVLLYSRGESEPYGFHFEMFDEGFMIYDYAEDIDDLKAKLEKEFIPFVNLKMEDIPFEEFEAKVQETLEMDENNEVSEESEMTVQQAKDLYKKHGMLFMDDEEGAKAFDVLYNAGFTMKKKDDVAYCVELERMNETDSVSESRNYLVTLKVSALDNMNNKDIEDKIENALENSGLAVTSIDAEREADMEEAKEDCTSMKEGTVEDAMSDINDLLDERLAATVDSIKERVAYRIVQTQSYVGKEASDKLEEVYLSLEDSIRNMYDEVYNILG